MSKILVEVAICPAFTSAINALAGALSGKVVNEGTDCPATYSGGRQLASALSGKVVNESTPKVETQPEDTQPEETPKRGRPAKKTEEPKVEEPKVEEKPKVDLGKKLEELCDKARELIKGGVPAAKVKAIATELGASKLSELSLTEENISAAEAALNALADDSDDDV